MSDLQSRIEGLWEGRDSLSVDDPEVVATVHEAIDALDTGTARVAEWNPDGSVTCLLYTSPSPRDAHESRMPSSA